MLPEHISKSIDTIRQKHRTTQLLGEGVFLLNTAERNVGIEDSVALQDNLKDLQKFLAELDAHIATSDGTLSLVSELRNKISDFLSNNHSSLPEIHFEPTIDSSRVLEEHTKTLSEKKNIVAVYQKILDTINKLQKEASLLLSLFHESKDPGFIKEVKLLQLTAIPAFPDSEEDAKKILENLEKKLLDLNKQLVFTSDRPENKDKILPPSQNELPLRITDFPTSPRTKELVSSVLPLPEASTTIALVQKGLELKIGNKSRKDFLDELKTLGVILQPSFGAAIMPNDRKLLEIVLESKSSIFSTLTDPTVTAILSRLISDTMSEKDKVLTSRYIQALETTK